MTVHHLHENMMDFRNDFASEFVEITIIFRGIYNLTTNKGNISIKYPDAIKIFKSKIPKKNLELFME
ncbi:hypothetical protein G9A89_001604 [Geosiphon pyriformis]|nr:hypothetical protein G9A89_001604 [Geosiphon pyriformis]